MKLFMKFYSTNKKSPLLNFKDVLMTGLATDGGLFMPKSFPMMDKQFLKNIEKKKFWEIALEISKKFVTDIPERDLKKIIKNAFNFEVPLVKLAENLYVLELFHGPTLAFKDFGARFMARLMDYYLRRNKKNLNIIVATSGDTGSAVARGFYGLSNIKVFVLYPSKRVTPLQEKQMATLGKNIIAIKVSGNFDDCQRLAKQVLSDEKLRSQILLSSANSINFGRLLPQLFYYWWAFARMRKLRNESFIFCVPSGNFGNLTAGLIAKRMGLGVSRFIAATNSNDVIPRYLKSGKFVSRVSQKTISNAMDVGNPSNFARMLAMYGHDYRKIAKDIIGISVSDKQTRETIQNVYRETNYVCDPHTAVGIASAIRYQSNPSINSGSKSPIIILSTAHPAKFREIVEPIIGRKIELPEQLKSVMKKKKKSILMENNLEDLKKIILKSK